MELITLRGLILSSLEAMANGKDAQLEKVKKSGKFSEEQILDFLKTHYIIMGGELSKLKGI